MAHLEHLYYFIAMTIFICCFFASELHGCSRTLSVLFRVLPLLLSFVCCFLHRSITDIHGRCPCYFVSFRCYYHLFAVFCIGVSRIFTDVSVLLRVLPLLLSFVCCFLHRSITDIHGRCPCYSVPFRCYHILFAVFCASEYHGYTRTLSVLFRVLPLLLSFVCCFFASEFHGYSRTLSVLFRAIPLLSYFVCCFLHRSITDIHGRCPCYSVPFRCYYH